MCHRVALLVSATAGQHIQRERRAYVRGRGAAGSALLSGRDFHRCGVELTHRHGDTWIFAGERTHRPPGGLKTCASHGCVSTSRTALPLIPRSVRDPAMRSLKETGFAETSGKTHPCATDTPHPDMPLTTQSLVSGSLR